jgi:hypothetical protein
MLMMILCAGRSVVGVPGVQDGLPLLRADLPQHDRRVPTQRQYGNTLIELLLIFF